MLIVFIISPIRFSNINIIKSSYDLSYNRISTYLINIIVILELINMYYNYPIINFGVIIIYIFMYAIIDIVYREPIINNNRLNIPPKYISKSYIIHILILGLLIYKLISYKTNGLKYLAIINIIIFGILLYLQSKFVSCKYNLPNTWSKL